MNLKKIILCGLLAISLSGCSFSFGGFSNFGPGFSNSNPPSAETSSTSSGTDNGSNQLKEKDALIRENYNRLRETRSYIANVTVDKEMGSRFTLFAQQENIYEIDQLILDGQGGFVSAMTYMCQYFLHEDQHYLIVETYSNGSYQEINTYTKGDDYYEYYGGDYVENNGIILDGFDEFQGFWNEEDGFTYSSYESQFFYKTPWRKTVIVEAFEKDLFLTYQMAGITHYVAITNIGDNIFTTGPTEEEIIKENYTYLRETRSYIASVTVEKEYGSRFLLYAQQGDVYLIEQLIFDAYDESSQLVSYLCQLFQEDGQYKLFVERYIDGEPQENNVYTKGDGYYEWYGGNFAENNGIILDGFAEFQGFWNQENGFTYDYDGNNCYYKTPFGKNVAINANGSDLLLKYYEVDILHTVTIGSIGQDIFGLNG